MTRPTLGRIHGGYTNLGRNLAAQEGETPAHSDRRTGTGDDGGAEARARLNSDTCRPFPKPKSGRIAVKVINHLGDEVMKVFGVP
jgi:adenine-specific DNA-methyltransferase